MIIAILDIEISLMLFNSMICLVSSLVGLALPGLVNPPVASVVGADEDVFLRGGRLRPRRPGLG